MWTIFYSNFRDYMEYFTADQIYKMYQLNKLVYKQLIDYDTARANARYILGD